MAHDFHMFKTLVCLLVGKSFIDNADIYCFGRGLLISMWKHIPVYQYGQMMCNIKLTLKVFELNHKSEEIINFYPIYL